MCSASWPSVTESWHAHLQCREQENGAFVESTLSSGHGASKQAFMRRQDVTLPPDRGWHWTSDWQVGVMCASTLPPLLISLILFMWEECL